MLVCVHKNNHNSKYSTQSKIHSISMYNTYKIHNLVQTIPTIHQNVIVIDNFSKVNITLVYEYNMYN